MSKVWFITGTSKGFGRIWAEAALERGDRVAATARDTDTLRRLVEHYGDAVLPLELDVTDKAAVDAAVASAHDALRPARRRRQQRRLRPVRHDRGGHRGAGARADRDEPVRRAVGDPGRAADPARAGLGPHHPGVLDRRRQRVPEASGSITRRSGGSRASASRWPREVAAFGVNVTLVEPAGYSTDWAGPSSVSADPLPAYDGVREAFAAQTAERRSNRGRPRGDRPRDPRARRRRRAAAARVLRHRHARHDPRRVRAPARRLGALGRPRQPRPRAGHGVSFDWGSTAAVVGPLSLEVELTATERQPAR